MENRVIAFLAESPVYRNKKESHINDLLFDCGKYNGYVGVHKDVRMIDSYMSGASFEEESLDDYVNVHGGITLDEISDRFKTWLINPLTDIPKEYWKDYRILGFDTAHSEDTSDMWGYKEVKEETLRFKEDIEKYINNLK